MPPKIKVPEKIRNPAIPRAPAGMETDPETGNVAFSDPLEKKPKKVAELVTYKVEFPNMENRPWSVRPHFAHDWFRQMKTSALREGGELLVGDKRAQFIVVAFRTPRAAREFVTTLHESYYVPGKDIRTYVEKQAFSRALDKLHKQVSSDPTNIGVDEIIERATQHAESPAVQSWLQANQVSTLELESAVRDNPGLSQSLHAAVLEAEKDVRAKDQAMTQPQSQKTKSNDPGKLMFDPTKYIKRSGMQPIFKRLNVKAAAQEKFHEGDTVLVDMDGELVEGQVKTTSPTTATIAVLNDGEHDLINVPKERLSRVVAVRIPLEQFPKECLAVQHRLRLLSGAYVKVTGVSGKPGYTKVATFDNTETCWVPDEQLEVVARVAKFPEIDHDEWV